MDLELEEVLGWAEHGERMQPAGRPRESDSRMCRAWCPDIIGNPIRPFVVARSVG